MRMEGRRDLERKSRSERGVEGRREVWKERGREREGKREVIFIILNTVKTLKI